MVCINLSATLPTLEVFCHYYAYSLQHLRSLEHTMELYYPGYLQNRMKDIPREQKMDILKEETEK